MDTPWWLSVVTTYLHLTEKQLRLKWRWATCPGWRAADPGREARSMLLPLTHGFPSPLLLCGIDTRRLRRIQFPLSRLVGTSVCASTRNDLANTTWRVSLWFFSHKNREVVNVSHVGFFFLVPSIHSVFARTKAWKFNSKVDSARTRQDEWERHFRIDSNESSAIRFLK